jgi:signal transduction histidine kinase/CheY-like chemotaxis protein
MQADSASLQVFQEDRRELRLIAWGGKLSLPATLLGGVGAESLSPGAVAARSGTRVVVTDVGRPPIEMDAAEVESFLAAGIRAIQATPLISRSGQSLGIISTHWQAPTPTDERALRLFDVLARQTADLLERAQSELRLREVVRQKNALYELADHLHRTRSLDEVYEAALKAIVVSLECDRASILLFDQQGAMRFVASGGLSSSYRRAVEGHSAWKATDPNPAPIHIDDVETAEMSESLRASIQAEGIGALAFIPLVSNGRLIGKFMAYFDAPHAFSRDDMDLCRMIARQIAFAIERNLAEDQLRAADRRKDEFIAMLSHELRNPLAAIGLAVQVQKHTSPDNPSQQQARDIIERQTASLTRLVDDLLEVSRITSGRIQLQMRRVALDEIVEHVLESVRATIAQHRHEMDISLPTARIWLQADPARLEQVLINLINNAAKYTDRLGRIQLVAERDGDQAVVLRVIDNGIGIEPELLPQVFSLFTQARRSLDRSDGGLGIGLSLVRRLVEMHGGTVSATSVVGKGSEFVVRLPVLATEATAEGVTPPTSQSAREPSLRILVVDDNLDAARSFALLLRAWGHEVSVAGDGPGAITSVWDHRPHVVFLDIGLPTIDGYEVARRLRVSHPRHELMLIALTGYGQGADRERALAAGFDVHLVKPADLEAVKRCLSDAAANLGPAPKYGPQLG